MAVALLEGGVLRGNQLDCFFGPFGLQVTDLAEEDADASALREDLGIRGLDGVLGIERPLPLCRLVLLVLVDECLAAPLVRGSGERAARLGVFVEERPRDIGAAADGGDADWCLFLT